MPPDSAHELSRRGVELAESSPLAEYLVEHIARSAPDGSADYVSLCRAENILLNDLVLPQLSPPEPPPARVLGYDAMVGAAEFREQLADFMGRTFLGRRVAPEHVVALAGAGTVLENVFYAIADPGDAVLIPTPSYAGFWMDLETRLGLRAVPVPCTSESGFQLTNAQLDAALRESALDVKALLIANPDNPLGRIAPREDVERVVEWAEANGLHVVFDEIYALSVFGATPFTSAASLGDTLGDHIHVIWGFSKDLGASGLRCGVLVSENEALLRAVDGQSYWGAVSGHTQWLLGRMIADDAWVDRYRSELARRLGAAYERVARALDHAGIPHVPAEAGIFVLCDLREFLAAPTWEAEDALWRRILDEAEVNLTPGSACHIAEPGFMRLCYASEPLDRVVQAIEKVGGVLR